MVTSHEFQDDTNISRRPMSNIGRGRRSTSTPRRSNSASRNPFSNIGRTLNQKFKKPRNGRGRAAGGRGRGRGGGGRFRSKSSRGGQRSRSGDSKSRSGQRSRSGDSKSRSGQRSRSGDSRGGRSRDSSGEDPRGQRKERLMVNYDEHVNNQTLQAGGRGGQGSVRSGGAKRGLFARRHGSNGLFARAKSRRSGGDSGDEELGEPRSSRGPNKVSPLDSSFKAHPWILPPYLQLAPRIDIWFAFAITSCAAVASIGHIHSSRKGMDVVFRAGDKFALSTCCVSFIFSFLIACGMRYAPLRKTLTRGLSSRKNARGASSRGQAFLSSLNLTPELLLLSILLPMWMASMPIIVNGNAYYKYSNADGSTGVPLAMSGGTIWNANLFYSSWFSFLLCGYLWVEVYTLQDRRGTLKEVTMNNTFAKRWIFLMTTSIIIMVASIGIYSSTACAGELLKSTNYCSRALLGILVGGVSQLLIVLVVGALYRLSHMNPRNSRMGGGAGTSIVSVSKRDKCGVICALISLAIQSLNTCLLTSATGGGPGNTSGILYFGSWLGLIFVFELCLRYLEFYSTTPSSGAPDDRSSWINILDDITAYEQEEDEENYSVLELQLGSDDGSGRKQLMNSSGHVVMVEDVQNGEDDDDDVESFVFGAAVPQAAAVKSNPIPRNVTQTSSSVKRTSPPRLRITKIPHSRTGRDPSDDVRSDVRSFAKEPSINMNTSGFSWGSNPVGSIDARSTVRSRSGDEGTNSRSGMSKRNSDPDGMRNSDLDCMMNSDPDSMRNSDPDGMFVTPNSAQYDAFGDDDDDGYQGDSFNFDKRVSQSRSYEPEARKQQFTSFHMDQVEDLYDPQGSLPTAPVMTRHPSQLTTLSPLEEGSGEEKSPNSDVDVSSNGPPTVYTVSSSQVADSAVGDNLRTMQSMRRVMKHVQNEQQIPMKTGSSRKSSVSSKLSRSRSSERKRSSGQASRHSRVSTAASRDSSVIMTDHSEQRGSRGTNSAPKQRGMSRTHSKKSMESRMSSDPSSASTLLSQGLSAAGSAILTDDDDESGSNPPPTLSDGMSTKDSLSSFSVVSNKLDGNDENTSGRRGKRGGPPPPPPFRRSAGHPQQQHHQYDFDVVSQYSSNAPVRSIHTKGSHGETDTIVSDPTLDAGFDPDPEPPSPMPRSRNNKKVSSSQNHNSSGSMTNSYDKKYSDETEYHTSDENPSSDPSSHDGGESGAKVVDNIVAAALAYAEKTHGESDNHGLQRVSGTSSSISISNNIRAKPQSKSFAGASSGVAAHRPSQERKHKSSKHKPSIHKPSKHKPSTHSVSGSIHSFYTEKSGHGGGRSGGDKSKSTGNPRFAQSAAPVDDLVAKALSHALGQLDGNEQPQQRPTSVHAPKPKEEHNNSEYSSLHWSSGKSLCSHYSENTDFSNQELEQHFDC